MGFVAPDCQLPAPSGPIHPGPRVARHKTRRAVSSATHRAPQSYDTNARPGSRPSLRKNNNNFANAEKQHLKALKTLKIAKTLKTLQIITRARAQGKHLKIRNQYVFLRVFGRNLGWKRKARRPWTRYVATSPCWRWGALQSATCEFWDEAEHSQALNKQAER